MIQQLKRLVKKCIRHFMSKRGFKTNQHLIVIESDDWGSIRSSNQGIKFIKNNYSDFKLDAYQSVDCLESEEDLQALFEVLKKYKDAEGNHPIVTAMFIMQNLIMGQDETIRQENFTDTYKRYNYASLQAIKNNMSNKTFYPQLHGLAHFNLQKHKDAMKINPMIKKCWQNEMIGLCAGNYVGMDAFNLDSLDDDYCTNIPKAAEIFKQTFGYQSETFVFPCYVYTNKDEKKLLQSGIKNIQTTWIQNIPLKKTAKKEYGRKLHYMGQKNSIGGIYTIRNCFFEPINYQIFREDGKSIQDCLQNCLEQIDTAFKNKKPAIICSHRANYVGGIDKQKRNENLKCLDKLLKEILIKYPDVKFVSSVELSKIIQGEKHASYRS